MEATIATGNIVIGTTIADTFWRALDAVEELGSKIIDAGIQYESSFAQLETIMNTAEMSTEDMSKGLRNLSKEMGISAGDLAKTAYNAISATEDTAGSLELVESASKLAVAGFTDSANSLSLLTQAMNAYGSETYTTSALADSFMQVQNMGVTTIGEMSKYMGRAIGNTQLYGASLADLEKSFIAYTKISPNVRVASTSISALFKDVGLSGSTAAKQLEKATGKTYKQLIEEGHDIRYVLDELYESVGRDDDAFAKLFTGTSRAAATNILKANIEDWNRWSEGVENSLNGATSVTDDAFATMADTAAFKGAQMEQIINDKFITLYEAIGPYLMELKGQFAEFIEGIDVDKVADTLMDVGDTVMNVIKYVKDTVIPTLVELSPVIEGVGAALLVFFGALKIQSVVETVIASLTKLWAVVMANPILAIVALIAGLVVYLVNLYKTNEDFRNKVDAIWAAVKETIGNAIDGIVTFFTETIPEALESMKQWFSDTLDSVMETFNTWGDNVMTFITETIPSWIDSIVQFFDELPYRLGYALGESIGTIIKWGMDTWEYLTTNVPLWIDAIVEFFATLPERLGEWLTNTWNNVVLWGEQMLQTGIAAATNFVENVILFIQELPVRMWEWLVNAANKVVEWGTNLVAKGREAITRLRDAVVEKAKEIPSKMADAGKDLVRGFWDGIQSMYNWIKEKVSGFFNGIVDGVKSVLRIGSPSKVFAEIGGFMAEGLGVGWDSAYKDIKSDIESGLQFEPKMVTYKRPTNADGPLDSENNGGIIFNQTVNNYSPEALSPWETARQTKLATQEMLLSMRGV